MNKKDLVMLIMAKKTLDYQKDPNPENWVTISGAKVHLDEGGKIDGGAKGKFNGKSYSGTKKSRKSATGSSESSKKYESKAREAVEYWVNTHYKNPSDKNIKDSVESVRMQMESMVKSAERNLNDAKKTGKEDLIKKYQDKFDEAKGTLESLNNYYDGGTVKKESAKEPKLGAPKMAESKSDFPLKEKNDDFYKKQAQATMRHWLIQKHMENTTKNKREIADEVRHDVEFWAEQWKRNYEIAKTDSRYTEKEVASLKEKAEGAQKELEWFNKLWPKKESKKSAPKSAGKEDDVKQVEITHSDGSKWHVSEVPGEKDVIFDWDRMERIEVPGGLSALMKKVKEKGLGVNENYTPPERKLEEYPPSREDRRRIRRDKINRRVSKKGLPPGAR